MTKQKWLSYNTQLLYKEDLPEKIGIRDGSPTFFSNPANTNGSKDEQNIEFSLKQIDNMHGHWFISLGQQEHAFLGSPLHL